MTRAESIKLLTFEDIILNLVSSLEDQERITAIVQGNYAREYKVDAHGVRTPLNQDVVKVVLINCIIITQGNFNEAYFRKACESFGREKIKTVHTAIKFMDDMKAYRLKKARRKKVVDVPEWMPEYLEKIKQMDKEAASATIKS